MTRSGDTSPIPIIAVDTPVMYEDEGQEELGESTTHTCSAHILYYGLLAHFAAQSHYRVLANLDVYSHRIDRDAYVSPDVMVVRPPSPLPRDLDSYRIGEQTPAPVLVAEVLSWRSHQQQDLTNKPIIYDDLGIPEYILMDVTGEFLPRRLLMRRLQGGRTWIDEQDADGGITSRLGFRVVLEPDGQLRVLDVDSGKRYARPEEAQAVADRVRALEEELARLRGATPKEESKAKKGKGRRPKS